MGSCFSLADEAISPLPTPYSIREFRPDSAPPMWVLSDVTDVAYCVVLEGGEDTPAAFGTAGLPPTREVKSVVSNSILVLRYRGVLQHRELDTHISVCPFRAQPPLGL